MALTPSTMLPLGTTAPTFNLIDTVSGEMLSLSKLKSNLATVVMFICNHCPYVKHILPQLIEVAKNYQLRGIQFIAINSNDVENYPEDAPDKMKQIAIELNFPFPYLYDPTQEVAKNYQAACTPDFYIFDDQLHCIYRGRFDDSTPKNNHPVTGDDLTQALDNMLKGLPINPNQNPSIGCNIKWKQEN